MLCSDTDFEHKAIRFENLDIDTLKQLDEHFTKTTIQNLIDTAIMIKSHLFRGNGESTMVWHGGNVCKFKIEAIVNNDERKPA